MKLTEIDSEVAFNFLSYRTGSELLFSPPTTDRRHYFPKEHWKLFAPKLEPSQEIQVPEMVPLGRRPLCHLTH